MTMGYFTAMLPLKVILLLLSVILQPTIGLDAGLPAYEVSSYTVPFDCELCDPKFNHFVIHETTGDVYLGASNNLVHLDSLYQEINTVSTFTECATGIDREECINHNKLLAIYQDQLITCGNYNGGRCQIRDTGNIETSTLNDKRVAAPGNFSTVYTIAPAATSAGGIEDMLYVGATDPENQVIPFFSRRRLEDPDIILSTPRDNDLTLSGGEFRVNYKDVFDFNEFTYFVTNQRFDLQDGDNIFSKINRVCHGHDELKSWAEVILECRSNGESYNLIQAVHLTTVGSDLASALGVGVDEQVLIGIFAKSVEPTEFAADNRSALCVFQLDVIEMAFLQAIAGCLGSTVNQYGIGYITGRSCRRGLNEAFALQIAGSQECLANDWALAERDMNDPITSTAIMEWPSTRASSIITTIEEEHTIAFIGTLSGQLMKVLLSGTSNNRVYETLLLGSPVLRDDYLETAEDDNQSLTTLTEQTIFKLRVENCGYYTTCDDCIGSTTEDGDPYCGWCSLTRTCSRKNACTMPDDSTRWLSYNEAQCLEISSVTPYDSQPQVVQQEITVTVEQLPDLGSGTSYECVFDYDDNEDPYSMSSPATKSGNELACMTPEPNTLPDIPDGTDHITTLLFIRSTETGVKFVDTNHTFFECATHERCLDCARSVWDCSWCVYGDRCIHDEAIGEFCSDDDPTSLIRGMEHHISSPTRRGPTECAQLGELGSEVLLAVGAEREINVAVTNLPDMAKVQVDNYACVLNYEGQKVEVAAIRDTSNTDLVICQNTFHTYEANIQELTASMTLHWDWGGSLRTIDDEFSFQVTLFKCEVNRPDCSRCVSGITTRPELECGWCSESELCAVEDHHDCSATWLREDGDMNCPIPVITSMWPASGPIEGNTLIEINGTDLGRGFDTITSVTVAGLECNLRNDTWAISERLSCVTSMSDTVNTGDVIITVTGIDSSGQMNEAGSQYAYKDPQIDMFGPTFGPEAGGTQLTINGTSLETGGNINVFVGNTTCIPQSISDTSLICSTGAALSGYTDNVDITFDGAVRSSQEQYEYKDNPKIVMIFPTEAFNSGGRKLRVTGSNLDVVQTPEVTVKLRGKTYTELCTVTAKDATRMECPSPSVNPSERTRRQDEVENVGERAVLGFNMDGVTHLQTWSENNGFTFKYFEDPIYFEFASDVVVNEAEENLQIRGDKLNLASVESDVQVFVGEYNCDVTGLGLKELTCSLPLELLNMLNTCINTMLSVTVLQGNLVFEDIGQITLIDDMCIPDEPPELVLIIAPLVVLIVLFSVAVVVLHLFYKKRREKIIAQTTVHLIESLRRLHQEAERGQKQAQIKPSESIKLSNNVTIDISDVQIQYNQLTFKKPLGKGEFGKVFLAVLTLPTSTKNVAVKTVKDDTEASFTLKFLEEAMIMKDFDHPNVLGLLGLTFDPNGSPIVVLPYMKNGDLRSLLLKDKSHEIGVDHMLSFAHDGAEGMTYLSAQKFVHRDLAARNCMIDEQLILKIADFGLSRDMNESDYYRSGDRKAKLPVKWMAPESLAKRLYTEKSDVWSYAITLWEMFSRGMKPYPEVTGRDVYHHIMAGNRLQRPSECPTEIYDIMRRCWHKDPKERPSFRQIATSIQSISSSLQYSEPSNPTSCNGDNNEYHYVDPSYPEADANEGMDHSYDTTITTSDNEYMGLTKPGDQYMSLKPMSERKSSTPYVVSALSPNGADASATNAAYDSYEASQADYEVQIDPFEASHH